MSAIHIADTGLFVAMGQPSSRRYQFVRTFARRNNMTFVLPERVVESLSELRQSIGHDDLTGDERRERLEIIEEWEYNIEMRELFEGLADATDDDTYRNILESRLSDY